MKWRTATLLFLAIVALMVVNSADFFFHQKFYEIDDWAANSISVNRAKHFAEMYGNYSRWGFHHPGPAFFYLYAAGESLFFDKLGLVAAPFNGQLLAHLLLMTGFFVAILTVFSRWLPGGGGPWFVPAALAVSALHFSVMANLAPDLSYTLHAPSAIASPWSAHALVMPMLCLLTVGAAVAAGRGQYLPLLAFADGCLIHTHVAQPLFVGPLTGLAYAGLCWEGWRKRRAPWQEFGGSHLIAVFILGVFALPIIGDFFRGPDSNFAAILGHMRNHHGEHKPLVRAFFYFLQFGSYTEYTPNRNAFGRYDTPGALHYLGRNAAYYVLWLAATILALRPLASCLVPRRRIVVPDPAALDPAARRFLAWGGVFLGACFALTMVWGVIQDGPMTYFNAWFNYSLYQFIALLAVAALCARPEAAVSPRRWWQLRLGAAAGALVVFVLLAGALRVYDPAVDLDNTTRANVRQAIADSNVPGQPPTTKLLVFTQETWEIAAGVALQLSRVGQPFVVLPQWVVVVGEQHRWNDFPYNSSLANLQIFRLHARQAGTAHQPAYTLPKVGAALTVVPNTIDPSDGGHSTITFQRDNNNFLGFQVIGWSAPESTGTWNDGHLSQLAFHPRTAGGSDVEVTLDVYPLLYPQFGLTGQTIQVLFNNEPLGLPRVLTEDKELTYTIPSETWEKAADLPPATPTTLEFRFPNAVPPQVIDPDGPDHDMRTLAVGFRRVHFTKVEPPTETATSEPTPTPAVTPKSIPTPGPQKKPRKGVR